MVVPLLGCSIFQVIYVGNNLFIGFAYHHYTSLEISARDSSYKPQWHGRDTIYYTLLARINLFKLINNNARHNGFIVYTHRLKRRPYSEMPR